MVARPRISIVELRRCAEAGLTRLQAADFMGITKESAYRLAKLHDISFISGNTVRQLARCEDPAYRAKLKANLAKRWTGKGADWKPSEVWGRELICRYPFAAPPNLAARRQRAVAIRMNNLRASEVEGERRWIRAIAPSASDRLEELERIRVESARLRPGPTPATA